MRTHIEKGEYKAMIIGHQGANFSAGANLGLVQAGFKGANSKLPKALGLAKWFDHKMLSNVEELLYQGQSILKAMLDAASHHLDFNVSQFNQNKFLFYLNNVTYDLKKFSIKKEKKLN